MFDQEYDDKGDDKTLYDEIKEEMNQQAQVRRFSRVLPHWQICRSK